MVPKKSTKYAEELLGLQSVCDMRPSQVEVFLYADDIMLVTDSQASNTGWLSSSIFNCEIQLKPLILKWDLIDASNIKSIHD